MFGFVRLCRLQVCSRFWSTFTGLGGVGICLVLECCANNQFIDVVGLDVAVDVILADVILARAHSSAHGLNIS